MCGRATALLAFMKRRFSFETMIAVGVVLFCAEVRVEEEAPAES